MTCNSDERACMCLKLLNIKNWSNPNHNLKVRQNCRIHGSDEEESEVLIFQARYLTHKATIRFNRNSGQMASVVPISLPKGIQASRLSCQHKYLLERPCWHPGSSHPAPTINFSNSGASLPRVSQFHYNLASSAICCPGPHPLLSFSLAPLFWSPVASLSSSSLPVSPTLSHGLVQPDCHVQSAAFSVLDSFRSLWLFLPSYLQ